MPHEVKLGEVACLDTLSSDAVCGNVIDMDRAIDVCSQSVYIQIADLDASEHHLICTGPFKCKHASTADYSQHPTSKQI